MLFFCEEFIQILWHEGQDVAYCWSHIKMSLNRGEWSSSPYVQDMWSYHNPPAFTGFLNWNYHTNHHLLKFLTMLGLHWSIHWLKFLYYWGSYQHCFYNISSKQNETVGLRAANFCDDIINRYGVRICYVTDMVSIGFL